MDNKRKYERVLVETWAIEDMEPFSVKECLALEIECISQALDSHDDDVHWLGRLHDYMVYQVGPPSLI
jgi:hypothetical protein